MSSKRRLRRKECRVREKEREKECGSKRKHASGGAAQLHIDDLKVKGKVSGQLGAYKCRHCGFWHVGHTRGSRHDLTQFLKLAK